MAVVVLGWYHVHLIFVKAEVSRNVVQIIVVVVELTLLFEGLD